MELPEGEGPATKMTLDFFDYGIPVSVEAPPADEILTMEDLAQECEQEDPSPESGGDGYQQCGHMFTFAGPMITGSR